MTIKPRKAASDLEAQRNANPEGTLKRVEIEAAEYQALKAEANTFGNAANRQKTQLRNAIKSLALAEGLDSHAIIVVDGDAYKYAVSESERIDAAAIFELYENDEISRDQLIQAMNFSKEDVLKYIGGDVMLKVLRQKKGDKLDIRSVDLSPEQAKTAPKVGIIRVASQRRKIAIKAKPTAGPKRKLQPIQRAKR